MSSRVEKTGSQRFKPVIRSSGQDVGLAPTPIRPPSQTPDARPLPIARKASISSSSAPSININISGSSSASAAGTLSKSTTKSYVGAKAGSIGAGVPIFPSSSASRAGSMAPPSHPGNLRRSQTPQFSAQRPSVPRDTPTRQAPITPSPSPSMAISRSAEPSQSSQRPQRSTTIARTTNSNGTMTPSKAASTAIQTPSQSLSSTSPQHEITLSNGKGKGASRKPSNPPTAYVLFSQSVKPRLLDEAATPEGAIFDVNKKIRKEWSTLSQADKKVYQDDAAQRKRVWQSLMDDWTAENPQEAAAALSKRNSKKRANQSNAEMEPARDAYKIFCDDYKGRSNTDEAWKGLTSRQRQKYELQAQKEEEEYLDKMLNEEGIENENRTKRQKGRTISDDEAEYEAEVAQYGSALKARRVDTRTTAMSELSGTQFRQGRASKRTFELERKLKEQTRERQRQLRRSKAARERGELAAEEEEEEVEQANEIDRQVKPNPSQEEEGEEEIIDEGEEDEEEPAQSDVESIGAASEIGPPLRDNRFTVRTRIVDGQIVLDESSLQQERGNEAGMDGLNQEYIDVNEEDRFVNSATFSKRVGTERWDAKETQAFLKAVSMWGSDFEMISRMFPNRNRKQIRAKWRSMERTDSRSLDLAFKRKLPISLEEYGIMAGVDLSGEAPQIEAGIIKKAEEEVAQQEEQRQQVVEENQEVERDEQGREIVDEGDARMIVPRKKSATPARLAKSKSPSVAAETDREEEFDDDEDLPSHENAVRDAIARRNRNDRESSQVSATSHRERTRGGSTINAPSAAAEQERLRQEKKMQDQQRKERERLRRRSVPTNQEEVLD